MMRRREITAAEAASRAKHPIPEKISLSSKSAEIPRISKYF